MSVTTAWTAARARAIDLLADEAGVVVGVAVDHRDSLQAALARRGLPQPSNEELCGLKLRVAAALAPAASMLLLDPEYSAAQALAAGVVPRGTALAVALEAQGYGPEGQGDLRQTSFLPGWSAAKAAALGAVACKLLLPYRPDLAEQSEPQDEVVRTAVAACREAGVALVLEPVVYPRSGETLEPGTFADLVVATAERLSPLEPDILKLQYPGSYEDCERLDAACGPAVVWVLLGGGAAPDVLEAQIADACRAGASGFIVGRTLFDAALVEDRAASEAALREVALPMLARFSAAARAHARPWRERIGTVPSPPLGWWRASGA